MTDGKSGASGFVLARGLSLAMLKRSERVDLSMLWGWKEAAVLDVQSRHELSERRAGASIPNKRQSAFSDVSTDAGECS